ncbi:MAG: ABC transporter permease, partial [Bacteroidota bacterium]
MPVKADHPMLQNYFSTGYRNLLRSPLYSLINILGLALGLASCLLVGLFITHEWSHDRFHEKSDRLYEVRFLEWAHDKASGAKLVAGKPERPDVSQFLPQPMGQRLKEEIPGVAQYSRYLRNPDAVVMLGNESYEAEVHLVDPSFLEIFSFDLISGMPGQVLTAPNEMVLTELAAKKYFGNENPVGQSLRLMLAGEIMPMQIVGVAKNPPKETNFPFEILIPIQNRPYFKAYEGTMDAFNTPVYVELLPEVGNEDLRSNLQAFVEKHFQGALKAHRVFYELADTTELYTVELLPVTQIRLEDRGPIFESDSLPYLYLLPAIALIILLIACINYINLALSRASSRMKEVGIRKVVGAGAKEVISQFWVESQLLVGIALLVGVGLLELFLPIFNNFADKSLSLNPTQYPIFWWLLLALGLGTALLAGGYPAWYLSRFAPGTIMQGQRAMRIRSRLSRGLVVIQYAMTVFLITASLIMYQQMQFLGKKDLGFDQEQVILVPTYAGEHAEGAEIVEKLRAPFSQLPGVLEMGAVGNSFGEGWSSYGFSSEGEAYLAYGYRVDPHYVSTLGIRVSQGRGFSPDMPTDTATVMVNQRMIEEYGWDDPIGKPFPFQDVGEDPIRVIGVFEDYHFLSLEHEIEPMFLHMHPEVDNLRTMAIKLQAGQIESSIVRIGEIWQEYYPELPFDYRFLDEDIASQYASYRRRMQVMSFATFMAILIACMGLFGLAGLIAMNKTKEIGVRKVLGASESQLLFLLNREIFWLAVIAFAIAAPLASWLMQGWLDTFAFQITLGPGIFFFAALSSLLIALLTVSYQSYTAARKNPI